MVSLLVEQVWKSFDFCEHFVEISKNAEFLAGGPQPERIVGRLFAQEFFELSRVQLFVEFIQIIIDHFLLK